MGVDAGEPPTSIGAASTAPCPNGRPGQHGARAAWNSVSPAWTAGQNNGAVPAATPPSIDESKGHDSRIVRVVTHFTPHFPPLLPSPFPAPFVTPQFPTNNFPVPDRSIPARHASIAGEIHQHSCTLLRRLILNTDFCIQTPLHGGQQRMRSTRELPIEFNHHECRTAAQPNESDHSMNHILISINDGTPSLRATRVFHYSKDESALLK